MIALLASLALGASPDVLQSRGYGWILDRSGEETRLYHHAGGRCWPEPDLETLDGAFEREIARPDGSVGLTEAGDDQAAVYVFDRLAGLPAACASADDSPRAAVEAMAALMAERYPGFGPRGIDFEARRRAVLAGLPADAGEAPAWAAAQALLAGLDDAHLSLEGEVDGEDRSLSVSEGATLDAVHARPGERPERAWLAAWREGIEADILGGQGHVEANNRVFWGVRDGVGYLAVVTMGGFDAGDPAATAPLDAALDRAMTAFQGAKAVVVDVSNNRGGYDAESRRIAARFADRPRVAYLKRGWGAGAEAQAVEVRPSDRPGYVGPVWLLTSDVTVSAGETFTQMMRVLPQVTHAGTATRGALSDQTPVTLPHGWAFAMPMELYTDPDGRPLEGKGLEPTVRLDLYPTADRDHGHARAVRALMRRLAR